MKSLVQAVTLGGLQKDLPAIAVTPALHGGRNRAQHHDMGKCLWRDRMGKLRKKVPYIVLPRRIRPNQGLIAEGGQGQELPFLKAYGGEGFIAPMDEGINDRVSRMARLQEHPAWTMRPAGASCNLQDQLCCAFRGAKVAAKKTTIDIKNADQCYIGKMMPLRQHLGPDEDIRFTAVNRFKKAFELSLPTCRVAIDADESTCREKSGQSLLDSFGPKPEQHQLITATVGALSRSGLLETAMMATQDGFRLMGHQARIAMPTRGHPTAGVTGLDRREAATIHKEKDLLLACECFPDGGNEPSRQTFLEIFGTDVDDLEFWRLSSAGAVRKVNPAEFATRHVKERLHGRGGRPQHDRDSLKVASHDRGFARGKAESLLLFEGGIMLFIQNDQAETRGWGEEC